MKYALVLSEPFALGAVVFSPSSVAKPIQSSLVSKYDELVRMTPVVQQLEQTPLTAYKIGELIACHDAFPPWQRGNALPDKYQILWHFGWTFEPTPRLIPLTRTIPFQPLCQDIALLACPLEQRGLGRMQCPPNMYILEQADRNVLPLDVAFHLTLHCDRVSTLQLTPFLFAFVTIRTI